MSIPGSPNLLLMRQAAAAVPAGPFQLPASCRFSEDDTSALKRTFPVAGSRQIWTWSAWIKLGKLEDDGHLFAAREGSSPDNRLYLKYNSDATLYGYSGNSNHKQFNTLRKLRDPSAWFHVVWVWDSPNAIQRDRQVVWINGELAANITHLTSYTQNFGGAINDAIAHGIGYPPNESTYFDGYLSDVQFVDGMALHPSCWGEFSSTTGDWNPKAFALQTPNNGTTWSSGITYGGQSTKSGHGVTTTFDGDLSAGVRTNASNNNGLITFTPASAISYTTSIRAYNGSGSATMHSATWSLNGGSARAISAEGWVDIASGSGTLTSLSATRDGDGEYFSGIEIDGVLLIDGKTDNSASINDGSVWSSKVTSTASHGENTRLFSGQVSDDSGDYVGAAHATGITIVGLGITFKNTVRVYIPSGLGETQTCTIDGGSAVNTASGAWTTVKTVTASTTLNNITFSRQAGGSNNNVFASTIEVDGQLLVDQAQSIHGRNGYKLLSDGFSASRIADIGKDYANGLISKANGGKPILTTTDSPNYGDTTAGSVNTTDNDPSGSSVKSSIVFALSGYTIADVHHTVKGSGSAKAITNNGLTTISSDQSRLYGKSIRFSGSQRLSCGSNTDFALGGGDWCIEFWMYADDVSGTEVLVENDTGTGGISIQKNGDDIEVQMGSLFDPGTTITAEQWYHICVNRDSSTTTLFIDGVSQGTTSTDAGTSQAGFEIGQRSNGSFGFSGYLQDIRVYKAESKYGTSNFTPPIRNDWRPVNLEVGTSNVVYSKTHSGTFESNRGADKAFNGKVGGTDYAHAASGQTCSISWTAITGITQLRLNIAKNNTGDNWGTLELNDTDDITSWLQSNYGGIAYNGTWIDVTSQLTGTSLSKIEFSTSGNNDVRVAGIEVNGNLLVDPFYGDILTDSPTSYGEGTEGGDVRGNFCCMNPLSNGGLSLSDGNLNVAEGSGPHMRVNGTVGLSSGKWYFELTNNSTPYDASGIDTNSVIGIGDTVASVASYPGSDANSFVYQYASDGNGTKKINNGTSTSWPSGDTAGTAQGVTVMVAYDLDNNKIWFGRNGSWLDSGNPATGANSVYTLTSDTLYVPTCRTRGTGGTNASLNFGARGFRYTPPTGFKPLCTTHLPDPTIAKPSDYFDVKTWTGDGSATRTLNLWDFSPEFMWVKERPTNGWEHTLYDKIRGAGTNSVNKSIASSDSRTEASGNNTNHGYLSDWEDNGFSIVKGSQNSGDLMNHDGWTYVGFGWDAGDSVASTSNSGSATNYTRWTNATAGFSIIKATISTGSGYHQKTVDHGLGVPPDLILGKGLDANENWLVYHSSIGTTGVLHLNDDAVTDTSTAWKYTATSNSQFTFDSYGNAQNMIYYTWAAIKGYSHFGSWTGNGSANGPAIFTGMRPAYVLWKRTDSADNWSIIDNARSSYNVADDWLGPNKADQESSNNAAYAIDILSNGFKVRASHGATNASNGTYIYAAFAESPFSTARAR